MLNKEIPLYDIYINGIAIKRCILGSRKALKDAKKYTGSLFEYRDVRIVSRYTGEEFKVI